MCRKTLADSRPRVRGRFARNDDSAAVMPHETKKALAEKARKEKKANGELQTADKPASLITTIGSRRLACLLSPIQWHTNLRLCKFLSRGQ